MLENFRRTGGQVELYYFFKSNIYIDLRHLFKTFLKIGMSNCIEHSIAVLREDLINLSCTAKLISDDSGAYWPGLDDLRITLP